MSTDVAVLQFGDHLPRSLRGLTVARPDELDTTLPRTRRVVVVGGDADLAAVLTQLLRTERLEVEVAYVPTRGTPATRAYRLPSGRRAARRARRGTARRVPLIRDETGSVIAGSALWRPAGEQHVLSGEAVVDDAVLFDGDVPGVQVEPMSALPGLRARVVGGRGHRWVTGRAAQLGCVGVSVIRDGVAAPRATRRSTIYRHTEGWLAVR